MISISIKLMQMNMNNLPLRPMSWVEVILIFMTYRLLYIAYLAIG